MSAAPRQDQQWRRELDPDKLADMLADAGAGVLSMLASTAAAEDSRAAEDVVMLQQCKV